MRNRIGRGLILAALLAACAAGPARAAGGLTLTDTPGQQPAAIEINLGSATTSASQTLFISNTGPADVTNVLLSAVLRDRNGRPVAAGLQISDPTQQAPGDRVTLPAGLQDRQITLQISDLTATGIFTGYIAALDSSGTALPLTPSLLVVRHGADPVVGIARASADGEITLTAPGPALDDSLFVRETGGWTLTQTLTLTAGNLYLANAPPVTVTLTPAAFALGPGKSQRVGIAGTLPTVGIYSGQLTLNYGDQPTQLYTLTVIRTAPPSEAPFTLTATSPQTLLRPFFFVPVTARIPLVLTEQSGAAVAFYAPALAAPLAAAGPPPANGVQVGTGSLYQGTQVFNAAGAPMPAPPTTLTLAPGEAQTMTLVLDNLTSDGLQQGTVRVAAPSGSAATAPFVVNVKDDVWLPALVIALGVYGSYRLRRWLEVGRPGSIKELSLRALLDQIALALPDPRSPEAEVRRALETRLNDSADNLGITPDTDVAAVISAVTQQLNTYLAVQDVVSLYYQRDRLADLVPDPDLRRDLEERLEQLYQNLRRNPDQMLANENNALLTAADAIRLPIAQSALGIVQAKISAFQVTLQTERAVLAGAPPPVPFNADDQTALLAQLDAAKKILDDATQQAADPTADAVAIKRLATQLSVAYNQANATYHAFVVDRFRRTLLAPTAPLGFDDATWRAFRDPLLQMLPARYDEARKQYLHAVLGKLADQADTVALAQPAARQIADDAHAALDQVDRDPDRAQNEYNRLLVQYNALFPPPAAGAKDLQGEPAPPPQELAAALGAAPPGQVALPPTRRAGVPDRAGILAQIRRNDQLAMGITILVAVITGVQTLWASQPEFSGWLAYILAFLWGFGLSAVSQVSVPATLARVTSLGGLVATTPSAPPEPPSGAPPGSAGGGGVDPASGPGPVPGAG